MNEVSVGFHGPGIRGDCKVTVSESAILTTEIQSSVDAMYGDAIRAQVAKLLDELGNPAVRLQLHDSGALPWVIAARIEAVFHKLNGAPLLEISRSSLPAQRERFRRTRLYIPGNTPKFFPHAGLFGADCLIFDLEDAVPPDEKAAALSLVRHACRELEFGASEVSVRVNNAREAAVVAQVGAQAIYVPKVESAHQVAEVAAALNEVGSVANIIAIVESARGIINAVEIASSSPRLVAISLGIEDYLTDIRATRTAAMTETLYAHGVIINAARACGITPLASVFSNVDDANGMTEYARWAQGMGFEGVGCIHPSQIEAAMIAFLPNQDQVARAQKVVEEYERAMEAGVGAIKVDGKMVDVPIYERAKRVLASMEAR